MPVKTKAVSPPDERWTYPVSKEIRGRLNRFVREKFDGNWSHLARSLPVPAASVEEWKPNRRGWPSFKHLWKFVGHRLSIDWLITGKGPMQLERVPAVTDAGRLLELLRPRIQRLANTSEFVEEQAFDRLLIEYGVDRMLDLAAGAFVPKHLEYQRDLHEVDQVSKLSASFHLSLDTLDRSLGLLRPADDAAQLGAEDIAIVRDALQQTMQRIADSIPGWLREREAMAKWNQEKALKADKLVRQAASNGWHPYALTTAAEVAAKVEAAHVALAKIQESIRQPNVEIVSYLANIEHMLSQLRDYVAGLQAQHQAEGPPQLG